MATEDAKCNWMATLDSGRAFLSQSHLSFLLNFLLSALKDTWYRSLFQRYAKWPCWTGSDSLWAAHLLWRLSTVRHWRRNPFLPTSSTGVDVSFFFHEDSCWSASKTLFAECPKWRWVPWKTAAPSLRSDKQCDGRRWKSRWVCSTSVTRRRAHCGMGEWDLYFFVPSAAFPLITSESQQILLWLWRIVPMLQCSCWLWALCGATLPVSEWCNGQAEWTKAFAYGPWRQPRCGCWTLVWARESKSAGHELAQTW